MTAEEQEIEQTRTRAIWLKAGCPVLEIAKATHSALRC